MGVGSYTSVKFYGKKEDLEKIFTYGNDADEGDFYLRVFGIDDDTFNNFTNEERRNFFEKVGINSLVQATCSAHFERRKNNPYVDINVYSVYETPIGCWEKIAEEFPEVEGFGIVIREDDYTETEGEITIKNGEFDYVTPEDMEELDYEDDEDDSHI